MIKNVLNNEPYIFTIDNFISIEECEYIINKFKSNLQDAKVVDLSNVILKTSSRNNENTWFNYTKDPSLNKICTSIASLVNSKPENSESLQIIHYKPGQYYNYHYDGWIKNKDYTSDYNLNKGQRLVTAIMYLNNVEEGGETHFFKLNLSIKPKKGSLLVFYNTYNNSEELHLDTLHAGCEVKKGEKWACNLWFRSKVYNK